MTLLRCCDADAAAQQGFACPGQLSFGLQPFQFEPSHVGCYWLKRSSTSPSHDGFAVRRMNADWEGKTNANSENWPERKGRLKNSRSFAQCASIAFHHPCPCVYIRGV